MMRRFFIAALIGSAALAITPLAMAGSNLLRTAQTDQAPATLQEANPSKAEPMMMGPTADQNTEAYRRDYLACDARTGDARETCRDAVEQEYRPEVTNLAAECEALDAESKAQCLRGIGADRP